MQIARTDQTIQVGFSGTQQGMTAAQAVSIANLLGQYTGFVGHHGLCIGSDVQFDGLARAALGFEHMVIHPMANAGAKRGTVPASPGDIMRPAIAPLLRNQNIAVSCDVLLATPKEDHMVLRSGTWSTIRYALVLYKPVFVVVPNGAVIQWA
jgi:hypothetical protein